MIRTYHRNKKQFYLFRDYLRSLTTVNRYGERRRISQISSPIEPLVDEYVTLETGEELPRALLYAEGYVFAGFETDPGKVIRFNPNNLSDYTVLNFPSDGKHSVVSDLVYSSVTQKLYTVFESLERTVVAEIDPLTLEYTDIIDDNPNVVGIQPCLTVNDDYIFVLSRTSPSRISRYDINDYSKTSLTLTGRNNGHALHYDGEYVYATGVTTPGWIAKIDPEAMTFVSQAFASGDNFATDDFSFAGNYVYVGLETTSGEILRIAKNDLSSIEKIVTGIESACYGTFYDGTSIWALFATSPGKMAKINPETLAVDVIELEYDWCNELVRNGDVLFITFYLTPAVIARLTL